MVFGGVVLLVDLFGTASIPGPSCLGLHMFFLNLFGVLFDVLFSRSVRVPRFKVGM